MSTTAQLPPSPEFVRTDYIDFWNEVMVPKFIRWKHIVVDGLNLHSAQVFPGLEVKAGDKVVDAGCGFGDTTILLAKRVGPTGAVLGLDCCDAFLEFGRRDAEAEGLDNVALVEADVQTYPFEPVHDFCFSRFGTQFFENPVAGLRNMRRSLKPGGIMTMIVWRALDENPWLDLPKREVLRFLPPPGEDARTCGPGPFSMADPDVVARQLEIAGYTDIEFERIDAEVLVGRDVDEAIALHMELGPAGEVCRVAGEEAERRRDEITGALRAALAPFHKPSGILMQSSSWKVTARNV